MYSERFSSCSTGSICLPIAQVRCNIGLVLNIVSLLIGETTDHTLIF